MSSNGKRSKKILEKVRGGYAPVPFSVIDSEAFKGLSHYARSMLMMVCRQFNGKNNGHYQLTHKWLAGYGFTSRPMNVKAKEELIARGLIQQTKSGGMRKGAKFYAVTWLPISNNQGLDILAVTGFKLGAYALCDIPPKPKRPQPKKSNKAQQKTDCSLSEPSYVH